MRTEKELLKELEEVAFEGDGLFVTEEEFEIIEMMEEVISCEYVGYKDGAMGEVTYHTRLKNDPEDVTRSVYIIEE